MAEVAIPPLIRAPYIALTKMEARARATTDATAIAASGTGRSDRWSGSWLRPPNLFGTVWSWRTLGRSPRSVVRSIVMAPHSIGGVGSRRPWVAGAELMRSTSL
jgi:hypothetical protein